MSEAMKTIRSYFGSAMPVAALHCSNAEIVNVIEETYREVGCRLNLPVFVFSEAMLLRQVKPATEIILRRQDTTLYDGDSCRDSDGNWYAGSEYQPSASERLEAETRTVAGVVYEPVPVKFTKAPIVEVLQFIQGYDQPGIFILRGMAEYVSGAKQVPIIREMILEMGSSLKEGLKRLLFVGQDVSFDNKFSGVVYEARYELPSPLHLTAAFNSFVADVSQEFRAAGAQLNIELEPAHREEIATAGRGLTETEFLNVLRMDVRERRRFDAATADVIIAAKIAKLEKLGVKFSPAPDVMPGGYEEFKSWLNRRKKLFSATITQNSQARKLDLPTPKGVLLVGHPGTGKSLAAKAIAATLKVPTLAMDMGSMFDKHVGESEARMREFFSLVESLGPVVLFLDEIEKAFAGASGDAGDGGVTKRLFGAFLTWLNDKVCPAFVVATANDISSLPPEFTRKGRFDEIWFADLPTAAERAAIFKVHLDRHQTQMDDVLDVLAASSQGFVGAEIAAAVNEAALASFDEDLDTIRPSHILAAIQDITPLSVSNAERTHALRAWAQTAARNMSTPEVVAPSPKASTTKKRSSTMLLEPEA